MNGEDTGGNVIYVATKYTIEKGDCRAGSLSIGIITTAKAIAEAFMKEHGTSNGFTLQEVKNGEHWPAL